MQHQNYNHFAKHYKSVFKDDEYGGMSIEFNYYQSFWCNIEMNNSRMDKSFDDFFICTIGYGLTIWQMDRIEIDAKAFQVVKVLKQNLEKSEALLLEIFL